MRNVSAIFFFLCLTAPFIGTFTWLKYEKQRVGKVIKLRMIGGMDKEELVLLRFTKEESKAQLSWEYSWEFEYNGKMYDVVDETVKDDTIYYRCWLDDEETELNKQLDELVFQAIGHNPQNREKQNRLDNFLKDLFCKSRLDKNLFLCSSGKTFQSYFHLGYPSLHFSPPAPPPEVV